MTPETIPLLEPIPLTPQPNAESLDLLRNRIESFGFAVVDPGDNSVDALLEIGGLLGTTQRHVRSDGLGVAEAVASAQVDQSQEWARHRSEYQAYGTGETPAHSDGSYLDGVLAEGAGLRTVGPPAYLLLQVIRNAGVGGDSFLIDGKQVLLDMLADEPELLKILMTPGCITYCRDDQLTLHQPVFRLLGHDRVTFRFRSDSKAFAPEWALPAIERLRSHYCVDERFRRILHVADGQIMVVDNTRMLHGRTAFVNPDERGGRLLRRLWTEDDELITYFHNLENLTPASRAIESYQPYGPLRNRRQNNRRVLARRGIWLDDEASTRLKEVAEATHLAFPSHRDA